VAILVSVAVIARAALSAPAVDAIKIPAYTPGSIPFRPGQSLIYRVSWSGIPAAGVMIGVRPNSDDPELWTGEITVATNKLIDLVYKMRGYVRENFVHASLAPRDIYIKQSENRRGHEYVINFDHKAGEVNMVKRNRNHSDSVKFHSPNPVGPISGPLMALSQPLTIGSTLVFDAFVGHNRYVISLKVDRREQLHTSFGDFDTIRITPTMLYASDNRLSNKASQVTIWVTDDQRRLPLRVQAEAFIGHITADLVRVGDVDTYSVPDEPPADPKPPAHPAEHAP
jgi:hypothetical protein